MSEIKLRKDIFAIFLSQKGQIKRTPLDELERANNEVDVIMVYGGGSILMREFLEPRLEEVARRIRSSY